MVRYLFKPSIFLFLWMFLLTFSTNAFAGTEKTYNFKFLKESNYINPFPSQIGFGKAPFGATGAYTVDLSAGSGKDGNVTIDKRINFYSLQTHGRRYPDAVQHQASALLMDRNTREYYIVASHDGIAVDDEILLIQLQKSSPKQKTRYWRLFRVKRLGRNRIYIQRNRFSGLLEEYFTQDRVFVFRVPNYRNFTITSRGYLTVSSWMGRGGGLLVMRVKENLSIYGTIDVSGRGFRAPSRVYRHNANGRKGEGYCGGYLNYGRTSICNEGGGGDGYHDAAGGGGGGNGTAGQKGGNDFRYARHYGGEGGHKVSPSSQHYLTFGGAGGMGGRDEDGGYAGYGGHGGGIIMLFAQKLHLVGKILANGLNAVRAGGGQGCGMGGGGGGAGGSIYIDAYNISGSGRIYARGGRGSSSNGCGGHGGNGGQGRIFVKYSIANTQKYPHATPYIKMLTDPDPSSLEEHRASYSLNQPWFETKEKFNCPDFSNFLSFSEKAITRNLFQFVEPNGRRLYYNKNQKKWLQAPNSFYANAHYDLSPDAMKRLKKKDLRLRVYLRYNGKQPNALSNVTIKILCNAAPTITSRPPTNATEDKEYVYQIKVQDKDDKSFNYTLKNAPKGVKIDSKGRLTWTPNDDDAGKEYSFTLIVDDKNGKSDTQTWKVKVKSVNDIPKFLSKPPTKATEDKLYTYTPKIFDPDKGDSWVYQLTTDVLTYTFDKTTGQLSWTPNDKDVAAQYRHFSIKVCDKAKACSIQSWKVQISNLNDPPQITSQAPTKAVEDTTYIYQPLFKDPDVGDSHQWILKKSPKRVQFSSKTGKIEWTPNDDDVEKQFDFELEICDKAKSCDTQKWKVSVKNINDKPIISGHPPTEAYVGRLLIYQPKVTDPDPHDSHTWRFLKNPQNCTIDNKTGKVIWTPLPSNANQKVAFEIQVCDKAKACDSQKFQIDVKRLCTIDLDCPQQEICIPDKKVRICVPAGCAKTQQCPQKDQFCQANQCVKNPCTQKQCNSDEVCRPSDGKCIKACAGVTCAKGEFCRDGQCQKDPCAAHPCQKDEICDTSDPKNPKCIKNPCAKNGSCKHGRICLDGLCVNDPCPSMTCPKAEQRCLAGQCVQRQKCSIDLDCHNDQICKLGRCYPAGCYDKNNACKQGQICLDGTCKDDVCHSTTHPKQCDPTKGEFCRPSDATCAQSCATLTCPKGSLCKDGQCQKDPCTSVTCAAGKKCFNGDCYPDLCSKKNPCKHGRICNPNLNLCQTDPCQGVQCPDAKQICKFGQCVLPDSCQLDADCPNNAICSNGKCLVPECTINQDCSSGKLCLDGQCKDDPCNGVQCSKNTFCKLGKCVASCASVICQKDEICIEGQCKKDPCHGVQCQQDETCSNGKCVSNHCTQNSCKGNRICSGGRCIQDPCTGIQCPKGQTCQQGQCTGTQLCEKDDDCPSAGLCIDGKCTAPSCYKEGCPKGKLCLKGQCVENPCSSQKCNDDEVCRPVDGKCVKLCPECPNGQICVDGQCTADPCDGVTCQSDESCQNGQCQKDFCRQQSSACRYQRTCRHSQCLDDPCTAMKCPDNYTCQQGQCYGSPKAEPIPEPTEEMTKNDAGGNEKIKEKDDETIPEIPSKETGQNLEGYPQENSPNNAVSAGGCGCQSSSPSSGLPFAFLLLLLLLPLFKTRRSQR